MRLPVGHLLQGRSHHPFAHVQCQRVVVDGRQKLCGPQQPALRVLPADQRFGTQHLAAAQVDLGLVVQHQLLPFQRGAHGFQVLVVVAQVAVVRGIEHMEAVLATQLGLVHGLIGLAHQLVGCDVFFLRVERNPQAGRHLYRLAVNQHRLGSGVAQAFQHGHAVGVGGQVVHDGHKLVATQARQRVAFAQGLAHAHSQRHQQLVAHRVAACVVDGLEAVQVQEHHRQLFAPAAGLGHDLHQPVVQQHAVGQAGQGIEMGDALELELVFFLLRNVREQRHVPQQRAVGCFHGTDGQHLGIHLAGLAAVPDLARPFARAGEGVPHLLVKRFALPA